jgi:hypothetical protein
MLWLVQTCSSVSVGWNPQVLHPDVIATEQRALSPWEHGEDLLHRHIFDDAVGIHWGSSFHWIRWRRPRG